jgi:hypothetical protein
MAVVALAAVLPIAASAFLRFLEPGVGIDVPFSLTRSAKVWLVFHVLGSPSSLVWDWSLFSAGQHGGS